MFFLLCLAGLDENEILKITYPSSSDISGMLTFIFLSIMHWPITDTREMRLMRNNRYMYPKSATHKSSSPLHAPFDVKITRRVIYRLKDVKKSYFFFHNLKIFSSHLQLCSSKWDTSQLENENLKRTRTYCEMVTKNKATGKRETRVIIVHYNFYECPLC